MIHIGTSGWSYSHWTGVIYPLGFYRASASRAMWSTSGPRSSTPVSTGGRRIHQSPLTLTNCFETYFTSTRSRACSITSSMSLYAAGDLVEQYFRMPVLDARHRPAQIVHAEERPRFGPRIAPAGAMRRGVKAHRMFLADDDVAASAHRAGNHRPIAPARLDGPLAGDPDAAAEMLLFLREVVMRIDSLQFQRSAGPWPSPYTACLTSVSTRSIISLRLCKRELLRPVQVAEVGGERGMVLRQIREVAVGQVHAHRRAQLLRHLDVVAANLVADAARA